MPPVLLPPQSTILRFLVASDEPLSATDVADVLELPLGGVAHHVRVLAHHGLIAWAGELRHNGALLTFYEPTETGRQCEA